jgi:hypothetical protein
MLDGIRPFNNKFRSLVRVKMRVQDWRKQQACPCIFWGHSATVRREYLLCFLLSIRGYLFLMNANDFLGLMPMHRTFTPEDRYLG